MARRTFEVGKEGGAIVVLASGGTQADAARASGLASRTISRRMQDPAFRRAVREARASLLERALGKAADVAVEAVEELRRLLRDESPSIRLGAARAILEHSTRLRESVEFAERLDTLERDVRAAAERRERFESKEPEP
jgi:uncharacterized membrane-anchored protein YjiN (DUF445 family)